MKLSGSKENLKKVFDAADSIDVDAGSKAFSSYNFLMLCLAQKYGCTVEQATAVFVSTSPNNDYLNNLRSTVSMLDGFKRGLPVEEIVISTYNHCRARAWEFLHGKDFLSSTKGPKIKNFYKSIVNPGDKQAVTVDGHIVSAWAGQRYLMKDVVAQKFKYKEVSGDVRALAADTPFSPLQVQAIIWFAWKRINKIIYDPNLNLFGDHWGLGIDVCSLRPFKKAREKTRARKKRK